MQSAGVSSSARHIAGPHASQAVSCFPTKPNLRHPVRSRCAVETNGMAEKQPRQTQTSGTAAKPLGAGLPSLPLGQKPFCSAADGSARAAGCCHLCVMHRSFTPFARYAILDCLPYGPTQLPCCRIPAAEAAGGNFPPLPGSITSWAARLNLNQAATPLGGDCAAAGCRSSPRGLLLEVRLQLSPG